MVEAQVVVVVILAVNIIAWAVTFGKLHQQVKDLSETLHDGLIDEIQSCGTKLANLQGTVQTYIDMKK